MDKASQPKVSAAYEMLKRWTDIAQTDSFEALGAAAVYKTSVVIWLMLFQRLNPQSSLSDAVLHFTQTAPAELKTNKRLREGRLSIKTGSYSDARHRLTLEVAHWFEDRVSASIIDSTAPRFKDRRVFWWTGQPSRSPLHRSFRRRIHQPPINMARAFGQLPMSLWLMNSVPARLCGQRLERCTVKTPFRRHTWLKP